ncbi:MAG TPA: sigma factor-like helix-turn-helix DNA-binding protein, partial [Thermoleophilaceae bacterium]
MPTFDQLPAEQRAIIELVVQRGRTYEQLADALQITPERVRELAHDALVELSPRSAARVDADRRTQIADYVLNQQSSAEATATRTHLKRSEAGRMWVSSLLDSLEHMYEDGNAPDVPDAEAEEERPRRRERERERERERPRERERTRDRERDRDRDHERGAAARERPRRDEP